MKHWLGTLAGKLILFFGLISLCIIFFILYLVLQTGNLRTISQQSEIVYYPLIKKLDQVEKSLDEQVAIVRQASIQKDTSGFQQQSGAWTMRINPELQLIQQNSKNISTTSQSLADSLRSATTRLEENGGMIMNWILENYMNAATDSSTQASLPSREQAEFVPLVDRLVGLQADYKDHTSKLKNELHAKLASDSEVIARLSAQLKWVGLNTGVVILALLLVGANWLKMKFSRSLNSSTSILQRLVNGEPSEYAEPGKDELGVIIDSANRLSNNLKQYSSFAQSIGEGNVDFQFKPLSESDMLGNSLVQMRQKLTVIGEEDKKRTWVTEGLAKFADIMRRSDDYEALSHLIVAELVKYTRSSQGGLFIVNQDNEKDPYLQLIACYAFERRKYLQKRVDIGEGLVGQSYLERRSIHLKEIPHNYVTITSGLGGGNPVALLIIPLKVNELIEGVIELASFKDYQPYEIEFVEKVGEVIASTISNARINSRTRKLLEESQQHSEELRAQEEEMRQNMEEMQATQEQLHRQAEEMRKMHESLELEQTMLHMLMEHLPDRITYKDRQSKIIRVNKAKATRFKETPEQMVGKSDYDYFSREHADKAFREEQDLIQSGESIINKEEQAVTASGDVVWASTSRIPFKNLSGEVNGMFIITKDISELRQAQASVRDREKIIQQLIDKMPVFRYTIGKNGLMSEFWKSKVLPDLPILSNKSVQEYLPEVFDMIRQEGSEGIDLICKGVLEMNGEKEIFKHYLFKDSAKDGVYLGFAFRQ